MQKSRSLRFLFNRYLVTSLLLILGIGSFSNIQSYNIWKQYGKTFTLFDELSRFYEESDQLNFRMKTFIYTQDPLDFRAAEVHFGQADQALKLLGRYEDAELRFRFGLLANMLQTYREKTEAIFSSGSQTDAQKAYDSLDRLALLIEETYPRYARLVTSEMNRVKEEMHHKWMRQLSIALSSFIAYLIFAVTFSLVSVRSITRPVEELIINMNNIKKGDFDIPYVNSKSLEIGILLDSFEQMAAELKAHIDDIHEKSRIEKELIEKEKVLAETRLNALQGQMNPHFLFNTLSLISKMAYVEGAERTSDLMVRTASLLRYSLDMGGKTSTVEDELGCLENYIRIQEKRAGDRIAFRINRPREALNQEIPGMVLQPLVENAVVHGVKDLISDARITVSLEKTEESLRIKIADNGPGFPDGILKDFATTRLASSGIGLSNVRERLQLFYGVDGVLDLENRDGALAVITIPLFRSRHV